MVHQLLHEVEFALSDAVETILQLHFEMLVLAVGLQRDGEVIGLKREGTGEQSTQEPVGKTKPKTNAA